MGKVHPHLQVSTPIILTLQIVFMALCAEEQQQGNGFHDPLVHPTHLICAVNPH